MCSTHRATSGARIPNHSPSNICKPELRLAMEQTLSRFANGQRKPVHNSDPCMFVDGWNKFPSVIRARRLLSRFGALAQLVLLALFDDLFTTEKPGKN